MKLIEKIIEKNTTVGISGSSGSGTSLILKELCKKFDGIYVNFEENILTSEEIIDLYNKSKKKIFIDHIDNFIDTTSTGDIEMIGQRSRGLAKFVRRLLGNQIKLVYSIRTREDISSGSTISLTPSIDLSYFSNSILFMQKEKKNNLFNFNIISVKDRSGLFKRGELIYKNLVYCFEKEKFLTLSDMHKSSFVKNLKDTK